MISKVNSTPSFQSNKIVYLVNGKKPISKTLTKFQADSLEILADNMAPKGELVAPLSEDNAKLFQKFLDCLFGKKLKFGTQQKVMSNITDIEDLEKFQDAGIHKFISYGDKYPERQGAVQTIVKFDVPD